MGVIGLVLLIIVAVLLVLALMSPPRVDLRIVCVVLAVLVLFALLRGNFDLRF